MNFHFFQFGASKNYAFSIGFISPEDMPGPGWQKSQKVMNFHDFHVFIKIQKEALMWFGVIFYITFGSFWNATCQKSDFHSSLMFRTFSHNFSKPTVGNSILGISGAPAGKNLWKSPNMWKIDPGIIQVISCIYILHLAVFGGTFSKKSGFLRFRSPRDLKSLKIQQVL